ncbi:hypothetical protein MUP77_25760, partial [Candidatus Bathyarchaeota archaeon]|nr:hypothetical protein [Candidatus Bathyarchaeota archaeon]
SFLPPRCRSDFGRSTLMSPEGVFPQPTSSLIFILSRKTVKMLYYTASPVDKIDVFIIITGQLLKKHSSVSFSH